MYRKYRLVASTRQFVTMDAINIQNGRRKKKIMLFSYSTSDWAHWFNLNLILKYFFVLCDVRVLNFTMRNIFSNCFIYVCTELKSSLFSHATAFCDSTLFQDSRILISFKLFWICIYVLYYIWCKYFSFVYMFNFLYPCHTMYSFLI